MIISIFLLRNFARPFFGAASAPSPSGFSPSAPAWGASFLAMEFFQPFNFERHPRQTWLRSGSNCRGQRERPGKFFRLSFIARIKASKTRPFPRLPRVTLEVEGLEEFH